MAIENWDEIRTAYHVARTGTVSGAAEQLGVHHATVIRHIDALETQLGIKLFQRHARGYTATEAGRDLLEVARAADDQFAQLAGRLRGQRQTVSGELVVTSLAGLSARLVPALSRFREQHPDVVVRYLLGERLFRLEYGEAHVAIRAGAAPEEPDNVAQPFGEQRFSLYGSEGYLAANPAPTGDGDLARHVFVGSDGSDERVPFVRWMAEHVPAERVVFRANDHGAVRDAVLAGLGLGFVSHWEAERFPTLTRVLDHREEWDAPLWLVTHVDQHRTAKVQAFLDFLKNDARDW